VQVLSPTAGQILKELAALAEDFGALLDVPRLSALPDELQLELVEWCLDTRHWDLYFRAPVSPVGSALRRWLGRQGCLPPVLEDTAVLSALAPKIGLNRGRYIVSAAVTPSTEAVSSFIIVIRKGPFEHRVFSSFWFAGQRALGPVACKGDVEIQSPGFYTALAWGGAVKEWSVTLCSLPADRSVGRRLASLDVTVG
jgi:hypothetical protein